MVQLLSGIRELQSPPHGSVLTIGNFDGVHLGHQTLLARVVSLAREQGIPSVVMTFEPHPVKVLHPDRKLTRIFDFEDQRDQLAKAGIDILVVEPFSREFSQVTAERYLNEWVYRPFMPKNLIVGYDFSFGAERKGSIEFLKTRGAELGMNVEVIPPVKVEGELCSSTRIRQALEAGDVKLANSLLGRQFYVRGLVERGAGRGRTIGIPTANIRTTAETLPASGVYAGIARTRHGDFKTMVNIGSNPTFVHAGMVGIEAHLLDFTGDLYGDEVRVDFVDRLRSEKKFSSAAELVAQIHSDIERGRKILDALV
ncbi:MAG: bifunctional riboflavin kinase/FAD synthetase [Proteobacteria bacterium]|nr:MAG: bifunctional riboflavin kinase/FAD synthetase [Pseudomonadota bacterium]